jgi:hypothetical protein
MPRPAITTLSFKDKLRMEQDARDAERYGITTHDLHRVLDSASYALCRAFPATRAEFIFRGRKYHAVMQNEIMSIFRTADRRLICERRQT